MQRVLVLGVQRGDLLYHKRLQANHESEIDELQLAALFTGLYHSRFQVNSSFLDSGKDGISICHKSDSLWYSKVLCNDVVNGPTVLALYFDLTILGCGPCIEIAQVFSESMSTILTVGNKNSFIIDSCKSAQIKVLEATLSHFRSLLPDKSYIKSISTWKEVILNKETKAAPLPRQPSTNPTTTTVSTNSSSSSSRSCFDCFRPRRVDTSYREYTAAVAQPPSSSSLEDDESQLPRHQIEVIDYLAPFHCCVMHQELMTWRPRRQVIFTALHTCSDNNPTSTNDEVNITHNNSIRLTTLFHKIRRKEAKCNANNEDSTLFLLTPHGAIAVGGQENVLREFITTQTETTTIKQIIFDLVNIHRASEHLGVFSIAQKQLFPTVDKS